MQNKVKPVVCPNCGSANKSEPKPDHFVCNNCGSYYFLDSDEVNVNITYNNKPAAQYAPVRKTLLAAVGVVFIVAFLFFIVDSQTTRKARQIKEEKEPYRFSGFSDRVYLNSISKRPVFLRLATEYIRDDDNNRDEVNFHAVYIDPITKAVLKDELLIKNAKRLDESFNFFSDYLDGSSFIIYKKVKLFKIDQAENKLVNVTDDLVNRFKALAAGIANLESNGDNYIDVTTNDGEKFIYIPGSDELFKDYNDAQAYLNSKRSYTFRISKDRLIRSDAQSNDTPLKPGRKFFEARVLYQDPTNLIIKSHTVASRESPSILQGINMQNGNVLWSLPAKMYNYEHFAVLNDGYAVKYYAEDDTYISGVLILSPEGKILHDYQIGRNE